MCLQAHLLDGTDNGLDLLRPRAGFHDYEHRSLLGGRAERNRQRSE
jgi:hypothetical protein